MYCAQERHCFSAEKALMESECDIQMAADMANHLLKCLNNSVHVVELQGVKAW